MGGWGRGAREKGSQLHIYIHMLTQRKKGRKKEIQRKRERASETTQREKEIYNTEIEICIHIVGWEMKGFNFE